MSVPEHVASFVLVVDDCLGRLGYPPLDARERAIVEATAHASTMAAVAVVDKALKPLSEAVEKLARGLGITRGRFPTPTEPITAAGPPNNTALGRMVGVERKEPKP